MVPPTISAHIVVRDPERALLASFPIALPFVLSVLGGLTAKAVLRFRRPG